MTANSQSHLRQLLAARYGDDALPETADTNSDLLMSMAARGSCRDYLRTPVPLDILNTLCAIALASPTKSDLQQRDIILLASPAKRQHLDGLVAGQPWIAKAPMIAIFCGKNRRQRLLHRWHGVPFANDHFDAAFNATTDAAIALGAFVTAAEAVGLGCCPISAVRNEARAVSDLLSLPAHVFPLAGLAIGYPRRPPTPSKRLPLHVTCHVDRYREDDLQQTVQRYDVQRAKTRPYATQRFPEVFGETDKYGWSDDKVRQYSQPERTGFGAYIRA